MFPGINVAKYFPKVSQSRTISINAQYQILFCNPRDSLQISILARQLCALNSTDFLEIYKRATQRRYINKTNDLILNLTPENMTQHSRIE